MSQPSEKGVRVSFINNFNPLQKDPTANKLFHVDMSSLKEARISVTLFSFRFALYPRIWAIVNSGSHIRLSVTCWPTVGPQATVTLPTHHLQSADTVK